MRLEVSGNLPAEYAERISDRDDLTPLQQARIAQLADAKLADMFANDVSAFCDLLGDSIAEVGPQLQRALRELDAACYGDFNAVHAITSALHQIQKTLKAEARRVWLSDLTDKAEKEIMGVDYVSV